MSEQSSATTPLMAQYLSIKQAHPNALLFYRMGDFYELFFEDAEVAAQALEIALTKRGRHEGRDIPMCGVPVHSHETYLLRLIRKGHRVAICEQTEDPAEARKRGGKAVVQRDVVRVVTPGTITEESLLEPRTNSYLAALAETGGTLGLAWLDLSTGELIGQSLAVTEVAAELARLEPKELLLPERLLQQPDLFEVFGEMKDRLAPQPNQRFRTEDARRALEAAYGVTTLDGFGRLDPAEVAAAGALISYVKATQKGRLPRLRPVRRLARESVMTIDPATRRNLELVKTLSDNRSGSLLDTIDQTVTGPGARLLANHVSAPLTESRAINERLDVVDFWHAHGTNRAAVRAELTGSADVERALARLTVGRGGPRDLGAIRDGLARVPNLRLASTRSILVPVPEALNAALKDLGEHSRLVDRLTRALAPDLPLLARDGGFITRDYAPQLDEQITLRDEGRRLVAALQARYVDLTRITSLKIKHNNVLGYHVDVSTAQADKLMDASHQGLFIHRQTTANAVRFTTTELGDLERNIAEAADRALAIEIGLFQDLVEEVTGQADAILTCARAIAVIDTSAALAELASQWGWCRPQVDESHDFQITKGRHPVVEAALKAEGDQPFVPNDCDLSADQRLWLLTGPNMAGKSTFLRQNALIPVLAQMGSFVPAETAKLGVVDRLFSRVGAADDLARGRSTFMVEMVETAAILNQAGPRALVILDEIGRGTATFDGLSIAWACIEHLHDTNRSRSLFATHYHELTALAQRLPAVSCHTVRVKEWQGDVVFLHEVAPGTADRSYGLHVARLAGLPPSVVARARTILELLEQGEQGVTMAKLASDLPLFSAALVRPEAPQKAPPVRTPKLEQELRALNPDDLSPRDALAELYRLRGLLDTP